MESITAFAPATKDSNAVRGRRSTRSADRANGRVPGLMGPLLPRVASPVPAVKCGEHRETKEQEREREREREREK
jgi:hypothetical protein